MSHPHFPTITLEEATLKPESLWRKFPLAGLVVGVACIALAFVLGVSQGHGEHGDATTHQQFYYSYLTSFMFWFSIAVGALFFVLIHHGTRAGWGTVVRRIAENWMMTFPVFLLLVVPIIIGTHDLYHWSHERVVGEDLLLDRKNAYLQTGFFTIRSVAVIAILSALAFMLYRWSTKQDKTGDLQLSHKMRWWAPLGFVIFAVTVTVGSIDWMMSLQPHWYSTIFGVSYFSGSVMVSGAVMALSAMALQKSGVLEKQVTTEHYHDLGKWSFAFLVFWSYAAVSQLLLIWYANMSEETIYYGERVRGGWDVVSIALALLHFVIPFWFLMSRHIKRRKATLAIGAAIVMLAHYVDMFWIIQPNMHHDDPHFSLHIADMLTLVGIGFVVLGVYAFITARSAAAPMKDPRLSESLRFENM